MKDFLRYSLKPGENKIDPDFISIYFSGFSLCSYTFFPLVMKKSMHSFFFVHSNLKKSHICLCSYKKLIENIINVPKK